MNEDSCDREKHVAEVSYMCPNEIPKDVSEIQRELHDEFSLNEGQDLMQVAQAWCEEISKALGNAPSFQKEEHKMFNIDIERNRPREFRGCRYRTWSELSTLKKLRG